MTKTVENSEFKFNNKRNFKQQHEKRTSRSLPFWFRLQTNGFSVCLTQKPCETFKKDGKKHAKASAFPVLFSAETLSV